MKWSELSSLEATNFINNVFGRNGSDVSMLLCCGWICSALCTSKWETNIVYTHRFENMCSIRKMISHLNRERDSSHGVGPSIGCTSTFGKRIASCSTWHHLKTHEFLKMHTIHLMCIYANTSQCVLYYRSSINLTKLCIAHSCFRKSVGKHSTGVESKREKLRYLCDFGVCCLNGQIFACDSSSSHTNNMLQIFSLKYSFK